MLKLVGQAIEKKAIVYKDWMISWEADDPRATEFNVCHRRRKTTR